MTPYLRACAPPALVAAFPPRVVTACEDGSGGKNSPSARAADWRSAVVTPAPALAESAEGSTHGPSRSLIRDTTTAPGGGTAPAARLVPAPRATTVHPLSAARA